MHSSFWADAIAYVNYISNHAPTTALNNKDTPIHAFSNYRVDVSRCQIFGSPAAVIVKGYKGKFDLCLKPCIYLELFQSSTGDRFLDIKTKKIIVSCSATIFENFQPTNIDYSTFANLTKTAQQQPTQPPTTKSKPPPTPSYYQQHLQPLLTLLHHLNNMSSTGWREICVILGKISMLMGMMRIMWITHLWMN